MSRLITGPARLTAADLRRSPSDPLLDTKNFLNEVTVRSPAAISFAPGRPHEEPFDAGTAILVSAPCYVGIAGVAGLLDATVEPAP